jgi:hypothetical protein
MMSREEHEERRENTVTGKYTAALERSPTKRKLLCFRFAASSL